MTQARVGQSGVEVLYRVNPEASVTQTGAEVLYRISAGMLITQTGLEILYRIQPKFAVVQSGVEVLFKGVPCTTKRAQVWTIERNDGEVFRFTSLDSDLVFGGQTYKACGSLNPSAAESLAEIGGTGNVDLSGLLSDNGIRADDLMAGRFDNATVTCYLVPWQGTQAPRLLLRGTFSQVSFNRNGFSVEILGDGAKLQQVPLVRTLQPNCRWRFGDGRCGKDLVPLTVSGTVEIALGQRGFTDSGRTETVGYFSRGVVTFTSGNNAGISAEIKEHRAGGEIQLWPSLAFPIEIGDTYDMVPGCSKARETLSGTNGCNAWANFANFGGFPNVPGSDRISRSADVRLK